MGLTDVFFIGIGLSMDAFAVSICKGLKMRVIDIKQSLIIALFFGGFQAAMPFVGYELSVHFLDYVNRFSHWIAFGLLLVIGLNMIREAVFDKEEEACKGCVSTDFKELIGLAVATSIDALAVGVSFGTMGDKMTISIVLAVCIIGLTTFIISLGGVFIGNGFGIRYKKRSEIAGGIILIMIGLKIVLEHYNILC